MSVMQTIVLRDDWDDAEEWDRFVEHHDQARFCHLFGYAKVLKCYGYTPRNICFVRDGQIVAILPAVRVKSLFFGRRLVSQPFSEYGGLLLDPRLTEEEGAEIFRTLTAYVMGCSDVSLLEMHGNHGVPEGWRERWAVHSIPHRIAVLSLDRPVDELWRKVVHYSARKAVNQAQNHGILVESECNEITILERFFPLYLLSMKRLGVPPHSIEYYLQLFRVFGDKMIIFWAKHESQTVAGLLGFSCGSRVSIINTISDPRGWHLRPNDLLHWEFIKWAAVSGYDTFDFGSVRYQGQLDFKRKWGCELLEHKYYSIKADQSARSVTLDSSSDNMHTMSNLWSRYVPISFGKYLGPIIRKQLVR